MLVAAETVEGMRQIQLQVQAPLGGRHDLVFPASLDHPLALAAVADHVRLEGVRAVVLLVSGDDGLDVFGRLEVVIGEHTRPGRKRTRADKFAGLDQILIGEHVVRAGLRVAAGRHAVGEVGKKTPVLHVEHPALNFRPVRVRVDEARDDGIAGHVDDLGPFGHLRANPSCPTATIRWSVTTMSPSAMTSSPRIVITLAPLRTTVPRGRCLGCSITTAVSSGLGFWAFFSASAFSLSSLFVVFALERGENNRIEWHAEEAGADGPGDRLAAVGPRGVIGANVGELLERYRRLVHRHLGCLAAEPRQGQQVELVGDAGQHPSPVGRDDDLFGRFGLARRIAGLSRDRQMRAAIGAIEAHGDQALGRRQVDPIGLLRRSGVRSRRERADHGGVAPFGGNPDEVEHRP